MGILAPKRETGSADPILTRLANEDKTPWYKKPNLRMLYLLLFPTCMGIEMTSGFDSQMLNALQAVPTWVTFFNHPAGSTKGIITAAYSLGAILSLPLVGIANDRLGRRWAIMVGSLIQCVGAIIQCFAVNTGMYIVARMILGFGIPTCIVAGSSLIGELCFPKERAFMTSMFNVVYYVGSLLGAAVCLGTNSIASNWAWRLPSILQICPSLLQICFVLFLPESPRWLITKGRSEEAYAIFVKYHAEGDADSEFARAEMAQVQSTLNTEAETRKATWADLFRTPGMRRRVLIASALGLFTQWSGNTLVSYYLSDILKMIGKTSSVFFQRINVGLTCWNLVVATAAAACVLKFKRRAMYLVCTTSLFLCYVGWTTTMGVAEEASEAGNPNNAAGIAVIAFIYLYAPCYNIGYNALSYTFLVELFPYTERSRGIALFQFFGRGAGFFSTFVNPIGLENVGWKYMLSYCCFLLFEIVFVYIFFPETSGRTLEELAFLFEEKELAERAVHAVEKVVDEPRNDSMAVPVSINEKSAPVVTPASHIETTEVVPKS